MPPISNPSPWLLYRFTRKMLGRLSKSWLEKSRSRRKELDALGETSWGILEEILYPSLWRTFHFLIVHNGVTFIWNISLNLCRTSSRNHKGSTTEHFFKVKRVPFG